jgi:hypothetical protein
LAEAIIKLIATADNVASRLTPSRMTSLLSAPRCRAGKQWRSTAPSTEPPMVEASVTRKTHPDVTLDPFRFN